MRPLKRRVSVKSACSALCRVVIHLAAGDPSAVKDHGDDMRQLELFATGASSSPRECTNREEMTNGVDTGVSDAEG